MEMAYAYGPHMLAHDRRIFDKPLAEQLRLRTSDIIACNNTMYPVIHKSVRDAKTQTNTGHQDIRTYFTGTRHRQNQTRTQPPTPRQNHRATLGRNPAPQQQRIWPRLHRPHPELNSDLSPESAAAYSNQDLILPRQPPPRQHGLSPIAPDRTLSPSDKDSNKHEPKSQRSHPPFGGSFRALATPAKSIAVTTPHTHKHTRTKQPKIEYRSRGVTPAAGPGRPFLWEKTRKDF
jgi:hypothetical protein